jgi:hypothetical protein
MTKVRAVAVSVVLVLAPAAAQAGPAVPVNLRGLNPSDPAVAARIQVAAEVACGPVRSSADTRFSALAEADSDHRACIRYAVATAMARVQWGPARAP